MGYSMKNLNNNFSPYIQVSNIDPKWLKAVGSPVPNPDQFTPIGAWRPHEIAEEKKIVPAKEGPLTAEVTESPDDFPGQSTLAD
jgi:hypothetical protein